VNNESEQIMRMLSTAFDACVAHRSMHCWQRSTTSRFVPPDRRNRTYFPTALASRIREIEAWMQPDVNSGVYKVREAPTRTTSCRRADALRAAQVGFATTQEDYDRAVETLFTRLDALEKLVNDSDGPFLLGSQLTDLDVRLYTTLVRFDGVY
jgi:putative glutathione S-transferase